VLSSQLFVEAQYSQRNFQVLGNGSPYSDFVRGTMVGTGDRGVILNSGAGSALDPEEYGNKAWYAKASYLLPTEKFGTHDLRAGFEWFDKTLFADYNFSGSGFLLFGTGGILANNQVYPIIDPGTADFPGAQLERRLIENLSRGDNFLTESAFFNDRV